MRSLAPVLFLLVPVNSFSNIQNTILTRRFDFKTISKYTLWATLAGSCVAVGMAAAGCGIWSLLGQRLLSPAVKSMLLWIRSEWRPSRRVSFTALRPMLGYSSRLLLSDITNTVYANISELFIGKMYTKEALGYYNRGKQYKDMPVSAVISSVQNVTFPALSPIAGQSGQNENERTSGDRCDEFHHLSGHAGTDSRRRRLHRGLPSAAVAARHSLLPDTLPVGAVRTAVGRILQHFENQE